MLLEEHQRFVEQTQALAPIASPTGDFGQSL
jgi:hypothetical protein